jgi:hypothetical protein
MAGYQSVIELHKLEERIDKLGFRMGFPKTRWSDGFGDQVALMPKDDCLPIYSRDNELYIGTLDGLRTWLSGFEKAREYDRMLIGNSVEVKRERKEQDYRNKQLMQTIKDGKLPFNMIGDSPNGV